MTRLFFYAYGISEELFIFDLVRYVVLCWLLSLMGSLCVSAVLEVSWGTQEEGKLNHTEERTKKIDSALQLVSYADSMESDACSICLCEYTSELVEDMVSNHCCCHIFHKACLILWLMHHNDCPICRETIML